MITTLQAAFGLQVLGGCCGTRGAHIRALAARLTSSPSTP